MPWSVVQTRNNAAGIVTKNLQRQGFGYYNPMTGRRRVHRGQVMLRRVQLFPNYLFVLVENRWRAMCSTFGVAQLLMAEPERPAVIADNYIEELKAMEDQETELVMLGSKNFALGQKVEVKSGPFALCVGLYDGQSDHDRVYVLLNLLGAQRRVQLDRRNLIAA